MKALKAIKGVLRDIAWAWFGLLICAMVLYGITNFVFPLLFGTVHEWNCVTCGESAASHFYMWEAGALMLYYWVIKGVLK